MWTNSNELLEHALRELKDAIANNKQEVEIILQDDFKGDINKVIQLVTNLEIRKLTEILRKEFPDYIIKSVTDKSKSFELVKCRMRKPCEFAYPIVWRLTLQKKA